MFATKMTPPKAKKWEYTRAKGQSRYIWVSGVLSWGSIMTIFMTLFMLLNWPSELASHSVADAFFASLTINAVIWPAAGYFWGLWTWSKSEKAYQAFLEKST